MDTLQSMQVFARVAQRSGFAAAARDLRMSRAAVTKHVAALEARVGARLLDRTTRSVALTDVGRLYLERCLECLRALEEADASVSELTREPQGLLRITAPVDLQRHLPPVVASFMRAHPSVTVDLRLSNRTVDLVEEGVDVAVRAAASLEGQFVARALAPIRFVVCGAPAYFRTYGRPRTPEELARHRHVVFLEPRPRDELTFERDGKRTRVKVSAAMLTNSGEAVRAAAVAGVALAAAPSFVLDDDLRSRKLEPLFLDWKLLPEAKLYALYPHRRFLAPKVRLFVDALRSAFGDGTNDPWWDVAVESGRGRGARRGGAR